MGPYGNQPSTRGFLRGSDGGGYAPTVMTLEDTLHDKAALGAGK